MEESIPNWLMQRAYLTPSRIGLVFREQSWTFAHMKECVFNFAGKLSSLSIAEGMRVGILMKNSPETIWAIHALQQLGAEIVFLNHRLTSEEITFQLEDSEASILIYHSDFNDIAHQIHGDYKGISIYSQVEIEQCTVKKFANVNEFQLKKTCSIMYTSGTTGKPKGVLQTYGNHWWSATGSALNLGLHSDDSWLCAVPLFHISGLSILMRSIIYGMPVYLMEQFDEQKANALLQSGKITIMSVVSAMLNRMLNLLNDEKYHENFRCMLLGGGAARLHQLEQCRDKGIPVFQTYGMTETSSQIVTLSPEDSLLKLGSAGKPLFPSQLKILTETDRNAVAGEAGEIIVKGPNVTQGYINRIEANDKAFVDGWFRTGDIGYVDKEGFLYVLDRRSDLIISGGENIYPAEIEEVILEMDEIKEAGVIGVEDAIWGKVPYAFIVSDRRLEEVDVLNYCRTKLAAYKLPKRVIQIEAIPRNGANKVMRRHLLQFIHE
ncbi:o-succinylbenzoate--CoA ligase [Lederbergia lenta]|uniref:2-succinylbenzoate--CoA ligase n=1 Tax=Lederbergia lenta TaxID=1467 RepID=A0A2X4WB38_LEDLE|nr:o-succinylbenzoate--CoA ligase [Lederbergia lenta]MCM3113439.1 o-succinylbenzoate--CoA ligase [Lederbergia lenta]MEC2326416.1 o-succinylbenzoate--CoA ligase [Lederbergia lenta]SQI61376.1 O-succinylbenzoate-CoA ligase [Lederbergia lenta]